MVAFHWLVVAGQEGKTFLSSAGGSQAVSFALGDANCVSPFWDRCGLSGTGVRMPRFSPPDSILVRFPFINFHKILTAYACMLSHFSHGRLSATAWTPACLASLSMGFSRQEYWSGLTCPPPGDLPDPGIEPRSPGYPALAGGFFTSSAAWGVLSKSRGTNAFDFHRKETKISRGPG